MVNRATFSTILNLNDGFIMKLLWYFICSFQIDLSRGVFSVDQLLSQDGLIYILNIHCLTGLTGLTGLKDVLNSTILTLLFPLEYHFISIVVQVLFLLFVL